MIRTLLLCLMTLVGQTATAEELEQGQLYAGGAEVTSESLGIRFVIPSGWQGGWPPGSELFILESAEFGARILLYMDEGTFAEMRAQATSPIQLDHQTTLTPTGAPAEKNGILRAQYTVSLPNVAASILGREARPGLLITATTVAQSAQFAQVEPFARQLIEGFSASAPPAQASVAGGWDSVLRGAHLLRLYTGSGYSEEEHIYLCSNGSFHRSNNAGGFGPAASGAFGAKGQGSWHTQGHPATGGTLLLVYGTGGETVTFSLHFDGNKLMVNNRRWFRDTNNFCK